MGFRSPLMGRPAEGTSTAMKFPGDSGFSGLGQRQERLFCLLLTQGLFEVSTQTGGQGPLLKYCNETFTCFNPFR